MVPSSNRQALSRVARQESASVTSLSPSALAGSTAASRVDTETARKTTAVKGSNNESAKPKTIRRKAASNQGTGTKVETTSQTRAMSDTSSEKGMKRKISLSSLR